MAFGVKVTNPVVVFTVAIPGAVPMLTDNEEGSFGPPWVKHKAQTDTEVFTPVEVTIGSAIGAEPVTLTVIKLLTHEEGNKLQSV